jgi:EF-P beta-lysylation protein EpmB
VSGRPSDRACQSDVSGILYQGNPDAFRTFLATLYRPQQRGAFLLMVELTRSPPTAPIWRELMRSAISTPQELLSLLDLQPADLPYSVDYAAPFDMRVPRNFVKRMEKGNPNDPLLRQVLSIKEEQDKVPGFCSDPLGEVTRASVAGLLQKYHGRVLLILSASCPLHCRYCFRREYPYSELTVREPHLDDIIAYIDRDPSITEVILSGGDPLTLSNEKLGRIIQRLAEIAHLKRVRVHTRFPIVLPERVDAGLVEALLGTRLRPIVVIHVNHHREIDESVRRAMDQFWQSGITLLNQSVLLRGVNNDSRVLVQLSEALFEARVLPYYLHLLDHARGAHSFHVSSDEAKRLMSEVANALPGYLVPKLVKEVAGMGAKLPVHWT